VRIQAYVAIVTCINIAIFITGTACRENEYMSYFLRTTQYIVALVLNRSSPSLYGMHPVVCQLRKYIIRDSRTTNNQKETK
jgi:hypothetical protein